MMLTRAQRRLADELDEHGVPLPDDEVMAAMIVEELDYCRRTPMFEGRRPLYGSVVTAEPDRLQDWDGARVELVELSAGLDEARRFSDARAAFPVRDPAEPDRVLIACFDRFLQFEADLVLLQQASGAHIIQRTPVFAVSRMFGDDRVVSWNGRGWEQRMTAHGLMPAWRRHAPDLDDDVASGLLNLAVHWLAPTRAGATLIVHDDLDESLDTAGALFDPGFSITTRHHLPAVLSALSQRDLATLIHPDGRIHAMGVGLRHRPGEERFPVDPRRGMRHRSAQHWSATHPDAAVIVVSSDGPVTAYRAGDVILRPSDCSADPIEG